MKIGINIHEQINQHTKFLANRTPQTTAQEEATAFVKLSDFRDGAIFAGQFAGHSSWECHKQGDEIIQVLEGEVKITILNNKGNEEKILTAGTIMVVPKGAWHNLNSTHGVTLITVTPQPTEVSIEQPHVLHNNYA